MKTKSPLTIKRVTLFTFNKSANPSRAASGTGGGHTTSTTTTTTSITTSFGCFHDK